MKETKQRSLFVRILCWALAALMVSGVASTVIFALKNTNAH